MRPTTQGLLARLHQSRQGAAFTPAARHRRRGARSSSLCPQLRTHSPEQLEQIAASIREWGWTVPVLVDEQNGLIARHARVMAAKQLRLAEIPVMVAAGWTEAQKRAYVIADNKLALKLDG